MLRARAANSRRSPGSGSGNDRCGARRLESAQAGESPARCRAASPWHRYVHAHRRLSPVAARRHGADQRCGPGGHVSSRGAEAGSGRRRVASPGPRDRPRSRALPRAPPAGGTRTAAASRSSCSRLQRPVGGLCPIPPEGRLAVASDPAAAPERIGRWDAAGAHGVAASRPTRGHVRRMCWTRTRARLKSGSIYPALDMDGRRST